VQDDELFSGGGQTGELMRTMDWSRTKLGPVSQWSTALKTAVGIALESRFAQVIWWGPELLLLYNDAYLPILGNKHPAAMAEPCRDVWAEVFHILGPMARGVLAGGPSVLAQNLLLLLNRRGFVEETYFDFSMGLVRDETAGGGVLITVQEKTEQVQGNRQLHMLRDLASSTSGCRTAEAVALAGAAVLGTNPTDVPFALVFLVDAEGAPQLAGHTQMSRSTLSALADHPWPFTARAVPGRDEIVDSLPIETPTRAIVLPLMRTAQPDPYGFLVVGLNPHRQQDERYSELLRLTADHFEKAISTAYAFDEERRRREALATVDRVKTAFFANVSHEFRTPLTLILGPIEEALAQGPGASLGGASLALARRNAMRLQSLVNTLLEFSLVEAGRAQAKYQPTELAALTIDLASAFRSLFEKAGLTLTVDCPPLAEPVFVDREMYEKIVLNLISNAFKFTFEGGLRVSLAECGSNIELVVEDTGVGIPDAEIPHLFERFYRVEGARRRSYEGSGIGLALVCELVKLHGGAVSVQSRIGEGTRFTVSIPRGRAHLPAERVEHKPADVAPLSTVVPFLDQASSWIADGAAFTANEALEGPVRGRILFADDNADMREYVHRLLSARGWQIETVSDGAAALERARAAPPDLVLADVMMPALDGFALLEAMKADPRTSEVPVILLSARAGEAASIEAMESGADDYLVKPFSGKELVSRISARLELAYARSAALIREQTAAREAAAQWQKLHSLFMQTPVGICILQGPQYRCSFANDTLRKILGWRELVGKPMLEALPELADQGLDKLIDQVMATGEPFVAREMFIRLDRGGGHPEDMYFSFVYSPKRGDHGNIDGVFVCCSDVTDQVQARLRAECLAEKLRQADNRKDEFLAMLAHELRNPMAVVSMALSLMELVEGNPEKTSKHRETARRQMAHLVRLVDDLLDVSRITRGKVDLRKERLDLTSVVQAALAATRPTITTRGHELFVNIGHGEFPLQADATRLEQVLVNLLTNAAKYTEPGGTIYVSLAREVVSGRAEAVLRVRDTGRGIPKDMLDKVFDLFVQVSPTLDRSTGGLGLGLTLVKSLVELHGGRVSAHSDGTSRGSEFVVHLPLSDAIEAPVADHREVLAADQSQMRRILVVEDSEELGDTLKAVLESLGHQVEVARDGLEGVDSLLHHRVDLALVDIGLPGIDGYEVARRVRAECSGDQPYMVALSGYGGPEAKSKAASAGFDLHLTKPIDINQLRTVVSRAHVAV